MKSLKGHLLVASPYLRDPNFAQTVVLMLHHTEEGSFGLVLNRRGDDTIKELWKQVADSACESDQYIQVGGPVAGPLMALHTNESLAEMEVVPGLYFAAEKDHLEKLVSRPTRPFRLFAGHSGWGGGQLENELEEGSWLTTPATVEHVFFEDDRDLWKDVAQQIGQSLLTTALKIKGVPEDPDMN